MSSPIQVPPVTGMTPQAIATELRGVIRDQIWLGLKEMGGGAGEEKNATTIQTAQAQAAALENSYQHLITKRNAILSILDDLDDIAKLRKPSEIRVRTSRLRVELHGMASHQFDVHSHGTWMFRKLERQLHLDAPAAQGPSSNLAKAAKRAYALVQGLPTIASPPLGAAENALRTIAVIIKVHHGLEFDQAVEAMPPILPDLLAAIKKPNEVVAEPEPEEEPGLEAWPEKEPLVAEWHEDQWKPAQILAGTDLTDPTGGFPLTTKPLLPWKIYSYVDGDPLDDSTIYGKNSDGKDFSPALPPGSPVGWNNGICGAVDAYLTFLHVRHTYTDLSFCLKDANGVKFAFATKADVTTHQKFGLVKKFVHAHPVESGGVASASPL